MVYSKCCSGMLLGGWADNELGITLTGTMLRLRASQSNDLDEARFIDDVKGILSLAQESIPLSLSTFTAPTLRSLIRIFANSRMPSFETIDREHFDQTYLSIEFDGEVSGVFQVHQAIIKEAMPDGLLVHEPSMLPKVGKIYTP